MTENTITIWSEELARAALGAAVPFSGNITSGSSASYTIVRSV